MPYAELAKNIKLNTKKLHCLVLKPNMIKRILADVNNHQPGNIILLAMRKVANSAKPLATQSKPIL